MGWEPVANRGPAPVRVDNYLWLGKGDFFQSFDQDIGLTKAWSILCHSFDLDYLSVIGVHDPGR